MQVIMTILLEFLASFGIFMLIPWFHVMRRAYTYAFYWSWFGEVVQAMILGVIVGFLLMCGFVPFFGWFQIWYLFFPATLVMLSVLLWGFLYLMTMTVSGRLRLLRHHDHDIRSAAAAALGDMGNARAIKPLTKALKDKNNRVRHAAAAALRKLGDIRDFTPFNKVLEDGGDELQDAQVKPLKNIDEAKLANGVERMKNDLMQMKKSKGPPNIESLIEDLKAGDKKVHRDTAVALGDLGDARAVEPLIKALKTGNEHVRRDAAVVLGKLGGSRAVESLVRALGDGNKDVRRSACEALKIIGDPMWANWIKGDNDDFTRMGESKAPRALEPLTKALGDTYEKIRCAAAEGLGNLGDPRAVRPLIRALGDLDINVRKTTVSALTKLGNCAVEPLIKELGDGYINIRQGAAVALGELGDNRAVEPLIRALGDGNRNVRKAAAEALKIIGEPKWADWIKGDNDDFRRMGKSKDHRAVKPLIRALAYDNGYVCKLAVEALGELGTCAVEPLIKVLADESENYYVRHLAAEALGEIGDKHAIDPLINALVDVDNDVRITAGEALAKFRDVHAFEHLIKPVPASGNGQNSLDNIGNLMDITLVKKSGEDTSG